MIGSGVAFFVALTFANPTDEGRLHFSEATKAELSRYEDCARDGLLKAGSSLSEKTASQVIEACSGHRASVAKSITADVNAVPGLKPDYDGEEAAAKLIQRFDQMLLEDLQGLTRSLLRMRALRESRAKTGSN